MPGQEDNKVDLNAPLSEADAKKVWGEEVAAAAGARAPVVDGTSSADADAAAKAAADAKAKETAAAAAAAAAAKPDKLDEVLKLARQAAEGVGNLDKRVRGVEGHMGTLKSDLTKVSGEVAVFAAAAKAAPAGKDAPTQAQIAAAAKSPEQWEKLKKDFPEIAEATEAYVATLRGDVDGRVDAKIKAALDAAGKAAPTVDLKPINEAINGFKTALSAKDVEIAELHVEVRHPGWKEVVVSPEFGTWLKAAPVEVRALSDSDKPSDAIRMMDLYKDAQKKAEEAARLAASRDRRLHSAAAGNVRGQRGEAASGKSAEDMSAVEIWNTEGKAAYESVRGKT